jgi:hypothetical protein
LGRVWSSVKDKEVTYASEQRWAKVTTLKALTIFLEALLHLEKRLEGGLLHEM